MPIIKSAIKRAKQTIKRRDRNVGIKRDIKEAVKAFHAKPSAETLSKAHSEIDTAVKRIFSRRTLLPAAKLVSQKLPKKLA